MAKPAFYRGRTETKHTGLGCWTCRTEHYTCLAFQRSHALDTRKNMAKKKGLFWGLAIWLMYWVFQEWFIYNTLLGEPLFLNILELTILMLGSLVEGIVIAFFLAHKPSGGAG
jgi:hypothetical protein